MLGRLFDDEGHEVVALLGDADGLAATVAAARPDLVVVDVRMPPTFTDEGARAARGLKQAYPALGVLVLSQHIETVHAVDLVRLGGFGYCSRTGCGGGRLMSAADGWPAAARPSPRGGSPMVRRAVRWRGTTGRARCWG